MTPWILVAIAGLLEVVWASGMKQTQGFTRLWPTVWVLGTMAVSFVLLARAMVSLPAGIAYTVWVGIGASGTVLVGVALLGEKLSAAQVVCLAAIMLGIMGLKLSQPAQPPRVQQP